MATIVIRMTARSLAIGDRGDANWFTRVEPYNVCSSTRPWRATGERTIRGTSTPGSVRRRRIENVEPARSRRAGIFDSVPRRAGIFDSAVWIADCSRPTQSAIVCPPLRGLSAPLAKVKIFLLHRTCRTWYAGRFEDGHDTDRVRTRG